VHLSTLLGASERIQHRPEHELHLRRVHGLSLLAEQLSLESLEFVEHEHVQLAVLSRFELQRRLNTDPRGGEIVLMRASLRLARMAEVGKLHGDAPSTMPRSPGDDRAE
jgi:hypothetical protein